MVLKLNCYPQSLLMLYKLARYQYIKDMLIELP